jgi:hypothetical protein
MKNTLQRILPFLVSLFSPVLNFCQAPDLGTAANFVLFTTTGAVSSTGISNITGDVGSGTGAISGFGALNGAVYNSDAVTTQASADLLVAYNQLNSDVPNSFPGPILGNGQVLTAGVYFLSAASSLNGNLVLDAQGNPNAVFIFQIGGAFSTNASSEVLLVNGALAGNIFWKVEGAVPMAAGTIMCGTIIANNAAISLGAGCILNGRALSTTGAVSIYGSEAFILPGGSTTLALNLLSFTGVCENQVVQLNWITAMESGNNYFSIERSDDDKSWRTLQTIPAAKNSSQVRSYMYRDDPPPASVSYYRLKQTDPDGNSDYGNIISVKSCGYDNADQLSLYPNPSTSGKFELLFTGEKSQVLSITIYNALGQNVYASIGFHSDFDLSDKSDGVYFVQVRMSSKILALLRVIKKSS